MKILKNDTRGHTVSMFSKEAEAKGSLVHVVVGPQTIRVDFPQGLFDLLAQVVRHTEALHRANEMKLSRGFLVWFQQVLGLQLQFVQVRSEPFVLQKHQASNEGVNQAEIAIQKENMCMTITE